MVEYEIIKYVSEVSYLSIDSVEDDSVIFSTREHGNTGSEEYGEKDYSEAKSIAKLVKAKFEKEISSIDVETVDEWVIMTVNLKKDK